MTDHTARLELTSVTWVVELQGREIARSGETVLLHETYGERQAPPVAYFPIAAVTGARLSPTDHHTSCPIKGTAGYYDAEVDGLVLERSVWYYPEPLEPLGPIAGYVAFYPDRFDVHPA